MPRRANELIPLSWDHHQGLNLARTIRETLAGETRFGDPSPSEMRALVADRWSRELSGHFADEEAVLGPLAARSPELAEALARMGGEHAEIRSLVALLAAEEGDETATLAAFAAALEAHIRFEERELFALVEDAVAGAERSALGEALLAHRREDGRGSSREERAVRGGLLPSSKAEDEG